MENFQIKVTLKQIYLWTGRDEGRDMMEEYRHIHYAVSSICKKLRTPVRPL